MTAPLRLWPEIKAAFDSLPKAVAFTVRHALRVAAAPIIPPLMASRVKMQQQLDFAQDCACITSPALVITGEPTLDLVAGAADQRGVSSRHVHRHEVAFATVGFDLLEALFRFFRDAPAENDFGSGAGEPNCHRAAEFTGSTDDDGCFAREVEEIFEVGCSLHGRGFERKSRICQALCGREGLFTALQPGATCFMFRRHGHATAVFYHV